MRLISKSAFINSTRGRSLYCTSIEYRQTINGYFKFHNIADNYGKYIVAFTIKSSDEIEITSCNFINNSVRHPPGETIDDVKPALIFANDYGKIATTNIDSEKSFYIFFEDCYVDFPNSSIFEYNDISFTNCIFDESSEETYPNKLLIIEDCLDQFIKDFLYKTSTFTPTYQFGQTYRFTQSQTFTNSDKFPSFVFSNSEIFSQTDFFTTSEIFSRSDVFLKTNDFSFSSDFSRSLLFSNTEQFSFSVDFTISNKFNDSNHFSKSKYFSDSEFFTSSCIFTKTESFTPKPSIPPTLCFSQSLMFSHSSMFSYSFKFTQSNDFTSIPTQSIYGHMISKQISYVESFVMVKSVSFSNSFIVSNVLSITFNSELGQHSYIMSQTKVYAMLPTIIQTMMMFELSQPKKQITAEQLIGIVCDSIAPFFSVLGTVILFLRRKQKTVYSDDLDCSSDDEVITTKTHETVVNLMIENINNVDLDQWL
ncbi:hypothetical protein M9Y10_029827 [Tritrichomonas musculus]|uniref:Uncharacterized protein n=1 Tax=Tritrichomonas musculus TaxID=1915356 RepID=A0ABR2KNM7_9EUKA